ncbi:MAG: hypothetical protein AAF443_05795 [Chlamydiota bacterium]
MTDLITAYQSHLPRLASSNSIGSLLRVYLADGLVQPQELIASLAKGEEDPIEHPNDFLLRCRHFLSVLFLAKLSHQLSDSLLAVATLFFDRLERSSYWTTFQTGATLLEIGASLIGKAHPNQEATLLTTGGALKESGRCMIDGAIPQPLMNAQLALNWLYLGIANREEKQIQAGLKVARFLLRLCDSEQRFFHALWTRESECQLAELFSYCQLLFHVAATISAEKTFAAQAKALTDQLSQLPDEMRMPADPFVIILALVFDKIERDNLVPKVTDETHRQITETEMGLLRYDYRTLSLACTASGVNTGLGALHKGKITIASFGPHFYPLADSERYGFYRTCSGNPEEIGDVKIHHDPEACRFRGWSRLVFPNEMVDLGCHFSAVYPGDQWMWFDLKAKEGLVDLTVKFPDCKKESPLAFVFFITAEQILIEDNQPLIPGVLDQFRGQSTPIRAVTGDHELKIVPHKSAAEMQVIPLSGKNHFWATSFLIAFSAQTEPHRLAWTIS